MIGTLVERLYAVEYVLDNHFPFLTAGKQGSISTGIDTLLWHTYSSGARLSLAADLHTLPTPWFRDQGLACVLTFLEDLTEVN